MQPFSYFMGKCFYKVKEACFFDRKNMVSYKIIKVRGIYEKRTNHRRRDRARRLSK
jgi:hypothetical protein